MLGQEAAFCNAVNSRSPNFVSSGTRRTFSGEAASPAQRLDGKPLVRLTSAASVPASTPAPAATVGGRLEGSRDHPFEPVGRLVDGVHDALRIPMADPTHHDSDEEAHGSDASAEDPVVPSSPRWRPHGHGGALRDGPPADRVGGYYGVGCSCELLFRAFGSEGRLLTDVMAAAVVNSVPRLTQSTVRRSSYPQTTRPV